MENNRILRAPDVSNDAVTINSAYDVKDTIEQKEDTSLADVLVEPLKETNNSDDEVVHVSDEEIKSDDREITELEVFALQLDEKEKELHAAQERLRAEEQKLDEERNTYREKTYEELKHEVESELNDEYDEKSKQIISLVNSLSEKMSTDIEGMEDELISIVFESVCKIIGEKMRESSSVISVVREVMKFSQDRMEMKLRVSNHDYDILQPVKEELSIGVRNRIDIVSDEHVRYGGCILETTAGRIDGRLEQQLNSLMQLLLNGKS